MTLLHILTLEDFQDERRYIEAKFLSNGYSLCCIEYLWKQFIQRFGFSPLQFICFEKYDYNIFRNERSRSMKYYRVNQQQQQQQNEGFNLIKNNKVFHIYYLYDWGSRIEFNRKFRELWCTILNQDPIFKRNGLKIILNSKHCYLSDILLAYPINKK